MKVHRVTIEIVSNGFLIIVNEAGDVEPRRAGHDHPPKTGQYRLVELDLDDAIDRVATLLGRGTTDEVKP